MHYAADNVGENLIQGVWNCYLSQELQSPCCYSRLYFTRRAIRAARVMTPNCAPSTGVEIEMVQRNWM